MIKRNYVLSIVAMIASILLSACGFGHNSERIFEGSYTRYSGDYPINEHWSILIKEDGSCSAINSATGFKNYTHEYDGSWSPVSDDVIKLDMRSKPYTAKVTRSFDEVEYEASKAQTPWKKSQAYGKSGELKSQTSQYTKTFYIRKDGAVANSFDGLNSPLMICR